MDISFIVALDMLEKEDIVFDERVRVEHDLEDVV